MVDSTIASVKVLNVESVWEDEMDRFHLGKKVLKELLNKGYRDYTFFFEK